MRRDGGGDMNFSETGSKWKQRENAIDKEGI